ATATDVTAQFSLSLVPVGTTTSLAATPTSIDPGDSLALQATVSSGSGAPNAGTVTFRRGGTELGTAAVVAGVASLTVAGGSTSGWPVGSPSVTAQFSGAPGFAGSTSAAANVTVMGTSTVTLALSPTSGDAGTSVTATLQA